jgi:hypothetical protein
MARVLGVRCATARAAAPIRLARRLRKAGMLMGMTMSSLVPQ